MSGILMKCLFLTYQHAICQAKLEYTLWVYLIACKKSTIFGNQKYFPQKFEFSKLIYSILGSFLRDEILKKSKFFGDQKFYFFQDFIPQKWS